MHRKVKSLVFIVVIHKAYLTNTVIGYKIIKNLEVVMKWLVNLVAGEKIKGLEESYRVVRDSNTELLDEIRGLKLELKIAKMYADDDDALLELVGLAKEHREAKRSHNQLYALSAQQNISQNGLFVAYGQNGYTSNLSNTGIAALNGLLGC